MQIPEINNPRPIHGPSEIGKLEETDLQGFFYLSKSKGEENKEMTPKSLIEIATRDLSKHKLDTQKLGSAYLALLLRELKE